MKSDSFDDNENIHFITLCTKVSSKHFNQISLLFWFASNGSALKTLWYTIIYEYA